MTNASVTCTVTSASAAGINPTLYVGLDLNFLPYRPPSSPTLGWKIPDGPAVSVAGAVAPASADGIPVKLQFAVTADPVLADAAALGPELLIVNGPQIPVPAEAVADGVSPLLQGTYSINEVPVPAQAVADGGLVEPVSTVDVGAAQASADGVAPSLFVSFMAAAQAAAVDPVAEVSQPFALAEAAAIPPAVAVSHVPVAASAAADTRTPAVEVAVVYTSGFTYTADGIATDAYDITVKPDESRVYVTNYTGNHVAVINTTTRATVTTIGPTFDPTGNIYGSAISPDGNTLYVSGSRQYILDTRTGLGTGALYKYDAILVVDTGTNIVTKVIPLTGIFNKAVYDLAVSTDGSTLYGLNQTDSTLLVVDIASETITATIGVGNTPTWMALSPSGEKAYVLNQADKSVSFVNLLSNTVTATVSTGITTTVIEQAALSGDGTTLYVCEYGYDIKEIDTATATVTHTMNLGKSCGVPFISGNDLYISGGDDYIYVIDRTLRTVQRSFLADGYAYYTLAAGPTKVFFPATDQSALTIIT